jgi:hypothetical protein
MEDLFAASFRTSGLTSAGFRQLIRGLQRAFGNEKVVLVEWSENRKLSRNGLRGDRFLHVLFSADLFSLDVLEADFRLVSGRIRPRGITSAFCRWQCALKVLDSSDIER